MAPFVDARLADAHQLVYVRARPAYRTTIDRTSSAGISISCKAR